MVPMTPDIPWTQRAVGAALAGFGGVCLAVQGRVNGQLGHVMRDGVFAALISTGIGLAVLVTGVAALPESRRGAVRLVAALRAGKLRWWQSLGGFCGAYVIAAQGVTIASLGVAVFTVAVVSGIVVASLAVDRAGLGPGGPRPVTATRALAAGLAVVAVLVAVSDKFGNPAGLWLAILPATAGLGIAWQIAVNGQVRQASGDVVVPSMVNFLTAGVALIVACAVDVAVRGWPVAPSGQWWLYLGGVLGVFAVMTAVFAVRLIGVLVLGLSSVAGQLVGAIGLDLAVPTAGGLSAVSVLGAAITMVAVAVAAAKR